jgi:hypothetical protein
MQKIVALLLKFLDTNCSSVAESILCCRISLNFEITSHIYKGLQGL